MVKAGRTRINAIGGKALEALTGRVGINIWRGSPLPLVGDASGKCSVLPTIHPAALMRQAKLTSVVVQDLKKGLVLPPEHYNLAPSLEEVRSFKSEVFAFDFEWDRDGNITHCGLSDRFYSALVVPFRGPYIDELRLIFERARGLIGHNIIGADLKYIEQLGWSLREDVSIEDTMLKQHLVQPDLPHDLAFVASVFTNKVFWKGKGWEEEDDDTGEITPAGQQWRSWNRVDALPRSLGGYGGCISAGEAFSLYNARDTDAEFQINTPLNNLLNKYQLTQVYQHVSRPIAFICRDLSERGLRLDTSRLGEIRTEIDSTIQALEDKLPEGFKPYEKQVSCNIKAPEGTYRPKSRSCSGTKKSPHPIWTVDFKEPGKLTCPVCGKETSSGKMVLAKVIKGTRLERVVPYSSAPQVQAYVDSLALESVFDGKTGRRTTGKRARKIWAKDHPEFAVLSALKEQKTLQTNFAKDTLVGNPTLGIPAQERMYFNLKVHGTSEGRLSSSGRRKGIDLNIQNQPNKFRVIYVPDIPGHHILNLDIVQGENWLTTWIAKDWARWERLQDPAYDEHSELASRIFGFTIDKQRTKDSYWHNLNATWSPAKCAAEADYYDKLRQVGKKINHGRNYGMGVKKQLDELVSQGFDTYTQADIKEFIAIWKKLNARTAEWQTETIASAEQQGYLRNAFGRVRWFTTRSIATEALAFLPASTLADMVLRMMIAHYPLDPRIGPSIEANQLAVFAPIVDGWRLAIQVHDSLVLMGPGEGWKEQAERSKMIMEQQWPALGNFRFRCEVKHGDKSWGECKTVEI
ncbi:MAG: hypothetical protein KGI27_10040 [Thaumarchaeota archaeon]|nr:hypothetical protein [Nitrososphaerota archaeon]